MTDDEIKERLARKLKVSPLPIAVWQTLEEESQVELNHVRDLREPEGPFWDDLVFDAAKAWRTVWRAQRAYMEAPLSTHVRTTDPTRRLQEGDGIRLSEDVRVLEYGESWRDLTPKHAGEERQQAEALGEYMALCASLNPAVRDFRRRILGGNILSPNGANVFVASLANRWFTEEHFQGWGITPVDHRAVPVPVYFPDFHTGGECVILEPLGEQIFLSDDEMNQRFADYFYFPSRSGDFFENPKRVAVGRGSILEELLRLSERLIASLCCSWNQAQTAWFVLTGEATPAAVLIARSGWRADHGFDRYELYGSRAITLTAEPWVSADEVKRAYRSVQTRVLERERNRESPEANRALFKFVIERFREALPSEELSEEDWLAFAYVVRLINGDQKPQDGLSIPKSARPSWSKLCKEWNSWYEDEAHHYNEVSNFRRAFLKTARRIAPRMDPTYSTITPPNYLRTRLSRARRQRRRA